MHLFPWNSVFSEPVFEAKSQFSKTKHNIGVMTHSHIHLIRSVSQARCNHAKKSEFLNKRPLLSCKHGQIITSARIRGIYEDSRHTLYAVRTRPASFYVCIMRAGDVLESSTNVTSKFSGRDPNPGGGPPKTSGQVKHCIWSECRHSCLF